MEFGAWSIVVIGVLIAVIGGGGVTRYAGAGAGLLAMAPGIGVGIAGILLVAFVQIGRATVDTAEYTQQMLKISRDQLEVSKQGLKLKTVVPQTFSAATPTQSGPEPKSSFTGQSVIASLLERGPEALELEQTETEDGRRKTEDGRNHISWENNHV